MKFTCIFLNLRFAAYLPSKFRVDYLLILGSVDLLQYSICIYGFEWMDEKLGQN